MQLVWSPVATSSCPLVCNQPEEVGFNQQQSPRKLHKLDIVWGNTVSEPKSNNLFILSAIGQKNPW